MFVPHGSSVDTENMDSIYSQSHKKNLMIRQNVETCIRRQCVFASTVEYFQNQEKHVAVNIHLGGDIFASWVKFYNRRQRQL